MVRCTTESGLSSDCGWVDYVQSPMPSDWNTISYVYDPSGRRIEKAYDGQAVMKYLYDGDEIIAEYDATGALVHKYIYGPGVDQPICMIDVADANATYYYHFDGLGSVIALTDSAGAVVNLYEYSIFGEVSASDPNHPNRFLFTGREFDSETGLYYYRARYYNPYIGRFLQTDPAGQGTNPYAYCGNGPASSVDPSGEWPFPIINLPEKIVDWTTAIEYSSIDGWNVHCGWLPWYALVGWQFAGSGQTLTVTGETFDLLLAESPHLKMAVHDYLTKKSQELAQQCADNGVGFFSQPQYFYVSHSISTIIGEGKGFGDAWFNGHVFTNWLINGVTVHINARVTVTATLDLATFDLTSGWPYYDTAYQVDWECDLVAWDETNFHPGRSFGHLLTDGYGLYLQWMYNACKPLLTAGTAQPYKIRFYKSSGGGGPFFWFQRSKYDRTRLRRYPSIWNIPWWEHIPYGR